MNTNLKANEFYVEFHRNGRPRDFFSVTGILFLGELMMEAAKAADLDPSKMTIDFDGHGAISLAYPSPATKIVTYVRIKDGKLTYYPRVRPQNGSRYTVPPLPVADPNLISQFAEVLKANLPKKSKFAI